MQFITIHSTSITNHKQSYANTYYKVHISNLAGGSLEGTLDDKQGLHY